MAWSKESRQSRGYGKEWERTRTRILIRDAGICQPCLRQGRIHAGTHVDHIVSKAQAAKQGWTQAQVDDESNLQTINAECHKAKTVSDAGHKVKPTIGPDGWPVNG
jgi:5-methylcytosine-specific restriction protein A